MENFANVSYMLVNYSKNYIDCNKEVHSNYEEFCEHKLYLSELS